MQGVVQDFVEQDKAGQDLKAMVGLIDRHGPDAILAAVGRLSSEERARVVVSTAHKAKGREWPTVRIAPDFTAPKPGRDGRRGAPRVDEARLVYVAVTRAHRPLDPAGVAWSDEIDTRTPSEEPRIAPSNHARTAGELTAPAGPQRRSRGGGERVRFVPGGPQQVEQRVAVVPAGDAVAAGGDDERRTGGAQAVRASGVLLDLGAVAALGQRLTRFVAVQAWFDTLRQLYAEMPPRVEYALAPLGRGLYEIVMQLIGWAAGHHDEIRANRCGTHAG